MSNRHRLRRFVDDWAPPRLVAVARKRWSPPPPPARKVAGDVRAVPTERSEGGEPVEEPRWSSLTDRVLNELRDCDEIYRPTNFWGPGLEQLLSDMSVHGLSQFKRWPSSGFWFLPVYGEGYTNRTIGQVFRRASTVNPRATRAYLGGALSGIFIANRDYDVVRFAWNQTDWPADLEGIGESEIGNPRQRFQLSPVAGVGFGRAYLNYLLTLAALSRHVSAPPRRFLEIGGGFGVLGEIVLGRDPDATYVNLDIPPLVTVSSYYLSELFGDRVRLYDDVIGSSGPIDLDRSAVLPNFRLPDIDGPFDVFVNSFSFQEMEPHVVEHYATQVSRLDIEWVVSLNSKAGKPKLADGHEIGVVDPVTSSRIIDIFAQHGYELQATYRRPLINSAGEVAILRRRRQAP